MLSNDVICLVRSICSSKHCWRAFLLPYGCSNSFKITFYHGKQCRSAISLPWPVPWRKEVHFACTIFYVLGLFFGKPDGIYYLYNVVNQCITLLLVWCNLIGFVRTEALISSKSYPWKTISTRRFYGTTFLAARASTKSMNWALSGVLGQNKQKIGASKRSTWNPVSIKTMLNTGFVRMVS